MSSLPSFTPFLISWMNKISGVNGDEYDTLQKIYESGILNENFKKLVPSRFQLEDDTSLESMYVSITFAIKSFGYINSFSFPFTADENMNVLFTILQLFILSVIADPDQKYDEDWWPKLQNIYNNWLSKNPKAESTSFSLSQIQNEISSRIAEKDDEILSIQSKNPKLETTKRNIRQKLDEIHHSLKNEKVSKLASAESASEHLKKEYETLTSEISTIERGILDLKSKERDIEKTNESIESLDQKINTLKKLDDEVVEMRRYLSKPPHEELAKKKEDMKSIIKGLKDDNKRLFAEMSSLGEEYKGLERKRDDLIELIKKLDE